MPLLLCGTLLFVPLLVSRTSNDTTAKVVTSGQSAEAALAERIAADRSSRSDRRAMEDAAAVLVDTTVPPTTTTEAPATTSTTVKRTTTTVKAVSVTAKPKPTTTTTRPPTTTTTKPPNQQTGKASWYDAPDGTCAHRTLAFGTILTVTNLANGKKVDCRVADRGPFVEGRIVDLAKTTFDDLAPPSSGIIDVRIEW